jgi:hypothetical protein
MHLALQSFVQKQYVDFYSAVKQRYNMQKKDFKIIGYSFDVYHRKVVITSVGISKP